MPKGPGSKGTEVPKFTGSRGQDASQDETFFWVGTDASQPETEGDGGGTGAASDQNPTHFELEVTECAVAGLAIPTRPGGFKSRDLEAGGRAVVSVNTPRKEGCSCPPLRQSLPRSVCVRELEHPIRSGEGKRMERLLLSEVVPRPP